MQYNIFYLMRTYGSNWEPHIKTLNLDILGLQGSNSDPNFSTKDTTQIIHEMLKDELKDYDQPELVIQSIVELSGD